MTARGIRNNNPLNIEKNDANKWQGKIDSTDKRFEAFKSAVYGIRAGAALIVRHYDKKNCNTIRKLITVWAPAVENNVSAYVNSVSENANIGPDEQVDFHQYEYLRPVIEAMILHENGEQPYTAAQIDKGLALAGIEPSQKPLRKSKTVGAATAGTASTAGAGAVDAFQDTLNTAAGQLQDIAPMLDYAKYALLAVAIISFGYIVWRRYDDSRRLAR